MAAIKMSYDEATAAATSMRTEAEEMKNALDAAANEIISCIESSWGGTSGATVSSEIKGLKNTFSSFQDAVNNYAKFVDDSVAQWKRADEETAAAAANLTSGFTGASSAGSTGTSSAGSTGTSSARVTHTGLQE